MAMRHNQIQAQSMRSNTFAVGRQFELNGQRCTIDGLQGQDVSVRTERGYKIFKLNALVQQFQCKRLMFVENKQFSVAPMSLSDKQLKDIEYRKEVINLLTETDKNRVTTVATWESAKPIWDRDFKAKHDGRDFPSRPTAARWNERYKNSGYNNLSLLNNYTGAQGRNSTISEDIYQLMYAVIDEYVLCDTPCSIPQAYAHFQAEYEKLGFDRTCPTLPIMYGVYNDIPRETVDYYQKGSRASRIKHYNNEAQFLTNYPLSRVEMDAVVIQLGLLDDESEEYAGIAILMVAIDVFTKMILGYSLYVGKKAERAEMAAECLKDAVMLKEREGFEAYGLMSQLATDGGPAFNSNHIKAFCNILGIADVITEAYKPMARPTIERFFRTLRMQFLETVDGYLGSSRFSESYTEDCDAEKEAVHTISEFRQMFEGFIAKEYHLNPHRKLNGCCPRDVWKKHVNDNPLLVTLPHNLEQVNAFKGRVAKRKLQHRHGIELNCRKYNSRKLKLMFHKFIGKKVTVYYNELNIESLTVIDEKSGLFLEVPITDTRVKGPMSATEYTLLVNGITKGISPAQRQAPDNRTDFKKIAKKRRSAKRKADKARKEAVKVELVKPESKGIDIDITPEKVYNEVLSRVEGIPDHKSQDKVPAKCADTRAKCSSIKNVKRGTYDEY